MLQLRYIKRAMQHARYEKVASDQNKVYRHTWLGNTIVNFIIKQIC